MFDFDLRALAERQGPERAYLTIYLASSDSTSSIQHRLTDAQAFLRGRPVELEHFEENLKLVAPHIEGPFPQRSRAIFASWAEDYIEVVDLPLEIKDFVRVDSSPYIRPLAELEDEYEDFAVVVADNHAAEIYRVSAADATSEDRLRGDVKNRVKKGGWSQKRYARRREKELESYAASIADSLDELNRQQPFDRLVLLGSDETMRAIEYALSNQMKERLVGERSISIQDDNAIDVAFEVYFDEEEASEERLWEQIRDAYLSGGLAVAGATRVLEAAKEGRVEVMLVDRGAEIPGTRCRECGHLAHGHLETCYVCGSKDLFQVELVNELVELLAQTSAETNFTDAFDELAEVGSVAALTRY